MTDDPRLQAMLAAHEQLLLALLREIARNDVAIADRLAADIGDLADRARDDLAAGGGGTGGGDEAMRRFVEFLEGYVQALRAPDG